MMYKKDGKHTWRIPALPKIDWEHLFRIDTSKGLLDKNKDFIDALATIGQSDTPEELLHEFQQQFQPHMLHSTAYIEIASMIAGIFQDLRWIKHIPWRQVRTVEGAMAPLRSEIHASIMDMRLRSKKYIRLSTPAPTRCVMDTSIWNDLYACEDTNIQNQIRPLLAEWVWDTVLYVPADVLKQPEYNQCLKLGGPLLPNYRRPSYYWYLCVMHNDVASNLQAELDHATLEQKQKIVEALANATQQWPLNKKFPKMVYQWMKTFFDTNYPLTSLALLMENKPESQEFLKKLLNVSTKKDLEQYRAWIADPSANTEYTKKMDILKQLFDVSDKNSRVHVFELFHDSMLKKHSTTALLSYEIS